MPRLSSSPRPRRSCAGMTLIEMLISVGVSTIVIAAALSLTIFAGQSMQALGNYDDMNRQSRNALDTMTRAIRQAHHMTSFATNQLVFVSESGTTFSYTYVAANGANGTLLWTNGSNSGVLLTNIQALTFDISQRNPSNNFTFYSAFTNAAQAKLVDVNWECSMPVYFHKIFTTECVQTAKVVVRN